jgi:hypothetical protein
MLKTVSSITNAIGALNYKGTWNASTNTPTLVSSVGVKGDYYQVSVAGSTAINGISNWGVGDVIAFNGTTWQRIEGGADLNGVNLSVSGTTTLSNLTASTALALDANKNVVSVTNTGTDNNVLSTSPSITTPRVITSINDTNGNELFGVTATGSAVNEFTVANAATGNAPILSATGSDTNIGMALTPKGTGGVIFPAGAVGTPAITTSGDLNTGIYFPAADTIAFTEGGAEAMRIDSSGNVGIGASTTPTLSSPGTIRCIQLPGNAIVSTFFGVPSPYSQNIQIDIVFNNWSSNNVIALADIIVTLRQWANTGGTAFGKVFATSTAQAATLSTFNTTNVTTSQCTVTAASGGNYTLRITIDPSNNTDYASVYLVLPAVSTIALVSSVTVSLV